MLIDLYAEFNIIPNMKFPVYKTKNQKITKSFNLNTPIGRKEYFETKAGKEIEDIKNYIDQGHTFLAFFLAKKSAGKGTFSNLFSEVIGENRIAQIGIGHIIKNLHKDIESNPSARTEIVEYLNKHYRGFVSPEKALDSVLDRSTEKITIPSELIITLIKREIAKHPNKGLLIDGFPRTHDQVSYSLFFREIMHVDSDADFFILLDVCESIIDERIKYRVECPICKAPRNTKLYPTQFIEYDKEKSKFVLLCDNPTCEGYGKQVLQPKEGDELGIEAIRARLETDQELIEKAYLLHGVPKVMISNNIPLSEKDKFDDYEITPEYTYEYDEKTSKITTIESPWIIKDDDGIDSFSLQAPAGVLIMIKQIHTILFGKE